MISESPNSPRSYSVENYNDLVIVDKIGKSRFPVFLAMDRQENSSYALKAFPFRNGKVNSAFMNEVRFTGLKHKNILSPFYFQHQKEIKLGDKTLNTSFTLTEYASNGDLFELMMIKGVKFGEILVRTYFQQMIKGLEFLHNGGIAHLDLKFENLLIGKDFQLKIIDFDMAHIEGDGTVEALGTKGYRAPEIINSKCQDAYKADVFSAGVVLFLLFTGGIMPY